jgi:carbon-monoxide dehydrogenase medium subunit
MSLIVEVRIPSALAGWRAAFCRTARLPSDQAIVNVAVAVRYHQGFCADIHIAAGGIGNFPMRLPVAEHLLRGTGLTEAEIKHAIDRQQVEIEPPSDMLGSSEYRRALLGVLVRRAIRQCQAKENTT